MKDWSKTLIAPTATIREAIAVIDASSAQICLVVDEERRLLGTMTDGDIRRSILRSNSLDEPVSGAFNTHPHSIHQVTGRDTMLALMREKEIHHLPVVDREGQVIGLVLVEELLAPGEPLENWVVLMAGGLGTRLRPLTEKTPKPMLRVGNKPLLETILENFVSQDFRQFYISINYRADLIKEHFADGSRWGAEIRYLHEKQEMGTAGALSLIEETPTTPLLVMNGDLLTNVNFRNLLRFHQEQDSMATMCVREIDLEVPFGVVNINRERIVQIDEKPVHRFLVNAGIYLIEPSVLALIPSGRRSDMTAIFGKIVDAGHTTAVFPIREYWLDVGRPEQYRIANGEIENLFR